MKTKYQNLFILTVIFTLIIKIILSVIIPVTGDEAYFFIWGKNPDFGFYDHPPMAGWIMSLMLFLGSSEFFIRLPAVLTGALTGIGIYLALRPRDEIKAILISVLFLVSPINIMNVLISTDTLLIIFSFISAGFLFIAERKRNYLFYFLSGICLGMAFLSKYFAALPGFAYLVYFIFSEKRKDKTAGFLILFFSVIPFAALNVYWNYTHSWANIMFNIFNRTKKEEISAIKFFLFIIVQLYMITPPVLYYLFKKKREALSLFKSSGSGTYLYAFIVPIIILGFVSLKKVVGLHWVLSFFPFMYIVIFSLMNEEELVKSIKFMVIFSLMHLIAVSAVLSIPIRALEKNKNYYEIVLGIKTGAVIENLHPYSDDFILTTPSYTDSAILYYHSGIYFPVFDGGSHHGRQDDILTDFRKLDGKNILVLKKSVPDTSRYSKYFAKFEVRHFFVEGAEFLAVLGYDFNFKNYRDLALEEIREKYYQIPKYLPLKHDYFTEKYFQ